MTQVVDGPDGRRLAVESTGAPHGMPIFLLHATPGSRSGPRPRGSVLYRLGVQLICYDRPGYGGSDRLPGRSVADAASDVLAIADALGLMEFGVVGHAAGGPHALACAALLHDRVKSAAVLVGMAPRDATGLDWYAGMADSQVREYHHASTDVSEVVASLTRRAEQLRDDPESMLRFLLPELTRKDGRIVDDAAIQRQLIYTYSEAVRHGADGWVDDVLALVHPWGFHLGEIKVPVLLWHGTKDEFYPVTHSGWLGMQIRDAYLTILGGAAHFDAVQALPKVLTWVRDSRHSPASRSLRQPLTIRTFTT